MEPVFCCFCGGQNLRAFLQEAPQGHPLLRAFFSPEPQCVFSSFWRAGQEPVSSLLRQGLWSLFPGQSLF